MDGIVFDLDGTLWDTCAACAVAWNRVLAREGIAFREISAADVRAVTGLPHADCIRQVFGALPAGQVDVLIEQTMAEDNLVIAEMGGELYPGVSGGLHTLAARYPLFIVSNCQQGYIETFATWSGLGGLFQDHLCWGDTGRPKGENLAALMARQNLRHPLMVGDTGGDWQAARENGVAFLQVTYGFGAPIAGVPQAASFHEVLERVANGAGPR